MNREEGHVKKSWKFSAMEKKYLDNMKAGLKVEVFARDSFMYRRKVL